MEYFEVKNPRLLNSLVSAKSFSLPPNNGQKGSTELHYDILGVDYTQGLCDQTNEELWDLLEFTQETDDSPNEHEITDEEVDDVLRMHYTDEELSGNNKTFLYRGALEPTADAEEIVISRLIRGRVERALTQRGHRVLNLRDSGDGVIYAEGNSKIMKVQEDSELLVKLSCREMTQDYYDMKRPNHPNLGTESGGPCGGSETFEFAHELKHFQGSSDLFSKRGVLTLEQKLQVVNDSMQGCKALHAEDIAHGDVKVENILVVNEDNGEVRGVLIDFELNTKNGNYVRTYGKGENRFIWGTPYYIDELMHYSRSVRIKGKNYFDFIRIDDVDHKDEAKKKTKQGDVFAFGLVLLEQFVHPGHGMYFIQDIFEDREKVFQSESNFYNYIIESMADGKIDQRLTNNLINFILLMTHKDPRQRPTIEECLAFLENYELPPLQSQSTIAV